jgi:hypothetical protein
MDETSRALPASVRNSKAIHDLARSKVIVSVEKCAFARQQEKCAGEGGRSTSFTLVIWPYSIAVARSRQNTAVGQS